MISRIKSMFKSSEDKELSKIKAMAVEAFAMYNAKFPNVGLELKEISIYASREGQKLASISFMVKGNIPGSITPIVELATFTRIYGFLFSAIPNAIADHDNHVEYVNNLTQKPNPKKTGKTHEKATI